MNPANSHRNKPDHVLQRQRAEIAAIKYGAMTLLSAAAGPSCAARKVVPAKPTELEETGMLKFLYLTVRSLFKKSDLNPMFFGYYRTKDPSRIDAVVSQLRQLPRIGGDPSAIIGFLAQLFRSSPETKRLLRNERSKYARSVYLVALYRAALLDDARAFADKNGLSGLLQKLVADRIAPLATAVPWSSGAENDLFIGAYMASGDTMFIERILENFSSADDLMVSDGIRMGFMKGKWDNRLAPEGRESVTLAAARTKYRADEAQFVRVLTLMTATWALQSLSQYDDGIKRTVSGFFDNDPRLKNLLFIEQTAFGNYLTLISLFLTRNPDQPSVNAQFYASTDKSLSAFERLEPAHDAFAPDETFTIPGGQPN